MVDLLFHMFILSVFCYYTKISLQVNILSKDEILIVSGILRWSLPLFEFIFVLRLTEVHFVSTAEILACLGMFNSGKTL